jgi:hypothetical protein
MLIILVHDMLKIMIHHLLCIQGFEGFVYDEAFTKNYNKIIDSIKDEPDCLVKIVREIDDLCKKCPYKDENRICTKRNDILAREKELANFLKISVGEKFNINELFNKINAKISSKEVANNYLCENCTRRSICGWYKSRF